MGVKLTRTTTTRTTTRRVIDRKKLKMGVKLTRRRTTTTRRKLEKGSETRDAEPKELVQLQEKTLEIGRKKPKKGVKLTLEIDRKMKMGVKMTTMKLKLTTTTGKSEDGAR